jgi:hypothetical protein
VVAADTVTSVKSVIASETLQGRLSIGAARGSDRHLPVDKVLRFKAMAAQCFERFGSERTQRPEHCVVRRRVLRDVEAKPVLGG